MNILCNTTIVYDFMLYIYMYTVAVSTYISFKASSPMFYDVYSTN